MKLRIWKDNTMIYGANALRMLINDSNSNFMLCSEEKDMNGISIYQFDILNLGDNYNSVVMFGKHESGIGFYLREVTKIKNEKFPRQHEFYAYTVKPRILGNVYQNPKLAGKWWNK